MDVTLPVVYDTSSAAGESKAGLPHPGLATLGSLCSDDADTRGDGAGNHLRCVRP